MEALKIIFGIKLPQVFSLLVSKFLLYVYNCAVLN